MDQNELVLTLLSLKGWGKKSVFDFVKNNEFEFNKCVSSLNDALTKEEKKLFKSNIVKIRIDIQKNLEKGIRLITLFDKKFPSKLYLYSDPCIYLYYSGDVGLLSSKCITIIGTRNPSKQFCVDGKKAAEYFAEKGYTIVSGLAIGCDTIGHKASLIKKGKTIAVLPSDLINILPLENYELAIDIVKNHGLLISEYGIEHKFNKFDYAQRDRIQSLLSNVVLVIQSEDNGGTMICVKKSLKDKKVVFALKNNNLSLINNYIDCENNDDLNKIESYIN